MDTDTLQLTICVIVAGNISSPESIGFNTILILGDRIAKVGEVNVPSIEALGIECNIIDGSKSIVIRREKGISGQGMMRIY